MSLPDPSDLIPHRGRWKLIDRIEEGSADHVVASGQFDADFAEGHFPERAVVPGVALVEGLAQTMLCLGAFAGTPAEGTPMLLGMDRVRFRAPVFPPARVTFRVQVTERRDALTIARGTALCDGKRVCTAELMGTVVRLDG